MYDTSPVIEVLFADTYNFILPYTCQLRAPLRKIILRLPVITALLPLRKDILYNHGVYI